MDRLRAMYATTVFLLMISPLIQAVALSANVDQWGTAFPTSAQSLSLGSNAQASLIYVYALSVSYLGQDPASLAGSDLGASVSVTYVLNGQTSSTTRRTPFSLQADIDSAISISVTSSPGAWQFMCIWDLYGIGQRKGVCNLRFNAPSKGGKATAFFSQSTSSVLVYSLSDTLVGQDPASLIISDLAAVVTVNYALNGKSLTITGNTPIFLQVDANSQISFFVASTPETWQWLRIWNHYGYRQYPNTDTLYVQATLGIHKIVAYFKGGSTTVTVRGTYVDITSPAGYAGTIRNAGTVQKLDRAYELLREFTNIRPYNGGKIVVMLDPDPDLGASYAGNPVHIGRDYWPDTAHVAVHEISHDFMGIPEFDRVIFPVSAFVEGFADLGSQYVYYNVERSKYDGDGSRYLKELKEQYLDRGLSIDQLEGGPAAGILQDLTNRFGFDMWKRFLRTVYGLEIGPKESRTLQQRCQLFARYVSEAALNDLSGYFISLRFPITRTDVYVIAIPAVGHSMIGDPSVIASIVSGLAPSKGLSVHIVSSFSDLDQLVRSPPSNIILMNGHGEVMPTPASWPSWTDYYDALAANVKTKGWIFINIAGYPLHFADRPSPPWENPGDKGLRRFLSSIGGQDTYAWTELSCTLTSAGSSSASNLGLSFPVTQNFARAVTWSGVSPILVFYDGASKGASAIQMGQGYFLQIGLGDEVSDQLKAQMGFAFAYSLNVGTMIPEFPRSTPITLLLAGIAIVILVLKTKKRRFETQR